VSRKKEPDWVEELGGVRPLRDRDERVWPEAAGTAPRRREPDAEPPVRFEVEERGEALSGRAPGVDRRELRRLRRGEWPVEARVDLHGLGAAEAERLLRERALAAHEAGARCVLAIHGRGLHSSEGAVLKAALPGWLAKPPLGPRVLAFASAAPRDGGPGATYVLLRPV